jgi:aspartate aminotransferase
MTGEAVSKRILGLADSAGGFINFALNSAYHRLQGDPTICDFVFGNPHEMPIPAFSEALRKWAVPQNKDWFAYKMNELEATNVVAQTLRQIRGLPFEPEHICMTNGAFAALAVSLQAVCDPGDEVIFVPPPWFFYEPLILAAGAKAVRARCHPETFDLDLGAIEAAITGRTRAIIVNSPNNPTGKIYPPSTYQGLAEILTEASKRNSRPIYLLSDEAYSRIVFDGASFASPVGYYDHTLLLYTYGKTLLAPGQRLGYVAIPPAMPDAGEVAQAIFLCQAITGWAFPNALLQHALVDLEALSIDVGHLQTKRDRMVSGLREAGYQVHSPEGTFYLLPRSPLSDDYLFTEMLTEQNVYVLPGSTVELPGYFRISLTANDEMIDRALPGFAKALQLATG